DVEAGGGCGGAGGRQGALDVVEAGALPEHEGGALLHHAVDHAELVGEALHHRRAVLGGLAVALEGLPEELAGGGGLVREGGRVLHEADVGPHALRGGEGAERGAYALHGGDASLPERLGGLLRFGEAGPEPRGVELGAEDRCSQGGAGHQAFIPSSGALSCSAAVMRPRSSLSTDSVAWGELSNMPASSAALPTCTLPARAVSCATVRAASGPLAMASSTLGLVRVATSRSPASKASLRTFLLAGSRGMGGLSLQGA